MHLPLNHEVVHHHPCVRKTSTNPLTEGHLLPLKHSYHGSAAEKARLSVCFWMLGSSRKSGSRRTSWTHRRFCMVSCHLALLLSTKSCQTRQIASSRHLRSFTRPLQEDHFPSLSVTKSRKDGVPWRMCRRQVQEPTAWTIVFHRVGCQPYQS